MNKPILILGAGLSGLSAAYHIKKDYLLIEKEDTIGGLARSINDKGFYYDHAPHILYPKDEYTKKLIKKLLRGNLRFQKREAWIFHRKYRTYTRFPFQSHLYGLPAPLICKCILELIKINESKTRKNYTSYYDWMMAYFGKGIADEFIIPYSQKLWTVHPRSMNCDWLDNRVPRPNVDEIIKGAFIDNTKRFGLNTKFWYPKKGGIGALPTAFYNYVKDNLMLNAKITEIDLKEKKIVINNKEEIAFREIISSLPLPSLIKLIKNVPTAIKTQSQKLKYNKVVCVNIGVKRAHITDKHWIYFYDDYFLFNRISFPMNFSQGTVPTSESSICCEITYSRYKKLPSRNLLPKVISQLIDAGIITKNDTIIRKNTLKLGYAYVIYDREHRKNVSSIHNYLRRNHIYPIGRFGEWEYFNMDDAILSGKKAADYLS